MTIIDIKLPPHHFGIYCYDFIFLKTVLPMQIMGKTSLIIIFLKFLQTKETQHQQPYILPRPLLFFLFYLGFLSRTFTNHRTAGEGGGHFFNSSLPLPPALQTLRH